MMNLNESVLEKEERIVYLLRSLYRQYGYLQYKMSKFEEYDLYARNRDFLISDNIITFTDTNGRLMALKPDVTLSIVRNVKDIPGYVKKVFYNEKVYRVAKGSNGFKEIMQTGLECIGDIDDYNTFETVFLAKKSLELISPENVLNISHLGIITALLEELGLDKEEKKTALGLIGSKNMHELRILLEGAALKTGRKAPVRRPESALRILSFTGGPDGAIAMLREEDCDKTAVTELSGLWDMLKASGVNSGIVIDFSVISDMRYYNGIVFKGYINGVPQSVLSGGRYDRLLKKMGKKSRAIGFAVYMDFLERFYDSDLSYDVDAVICYNPDTDRSKLFAAVSSLQEKGLSVTVQKGISDKLRYRLLYKMDGDGTLTGPESGPAAGKEDDHA